MTVSRRKNRPVAKQEDNRSAESGVQYHCDVCGLDISSTVRISCATCAAAPSALDTYDLCCSCFLEGAESGSHKAYHDYRVVEQHAYPIFCNDWGADEELLLIDGAQMYGLGNWADIADHIGNRTKEEVQRHYIDVYIEGRDGTEEGDKRAERIVQEHLAAHPLDTARRRMLPVVGPNIHFKAAIDTEEFQRRKRQRIEDARGTQAAFGATGISSSQSQTATGGSKPAPPKPLVSAPTSHSELATFMPGRLEFETEYENDAENYVKDMEFGKVYRYGGEMIPSEMEALGRKADQGRVRMEGSGRGGPGLGQRGGNKGTKEEDGDLTKDAASKDNANQAQDGEYQKEEEEGEDQEGDQTREGDEQDHEGDEDEEDEEKEEEGDEDEDEDDAANESAMDGADITTDAAQSNAGGDGASDAATAAAPAPAATSGSVAQATDADDRAPDWDEEEADLELKLMVLDIYNERLSRRGRRKEFIFERNLVDYKRTVAAERKRPKEEREMLNRVRHFAQMQTAMDFEHFYNGLCYEDALRRAAAQLQMYRRAGITNLTDAARFDAEQTERARRAAVAAEGGLAAYPGAGSLPRSAAARAATRPDTPTTDDAGTDIHSATTAQSKKKGGAQASGTTAASVNGVLTPLATTTNSDAANGEKKQARKPPKPLDLSSHPSLSLLTRAEQELCSVVRIQPQVFMMMKKDIVVEYVRRKGKFSRRESRQLFKCDVNKVGRVYDLLESEGYLREAARLGGGWEGVGVPPGFEEKNANVKQQQITNGTGTPNASSKHEVHDRKENGDGSHQMSDHQDRGDHTAQPVSKGASVNGSLTSIANSAKASPKPQTPQVAETDEGRRMNSNLNRSPWQRDTPPIERPRTSTTT